MAYEFDVGNRPESASDPSTVKRRGFLRFGTLITAITGASAVSSIGAGSAEAATGDLTTYIPIAEKATPSGVATLDADAKILPAQLPDLTASVRDIATPRWKPNTAYAGGDTVVSPAGDIVTARENFTSAGTYDSARWSLVPNFKDKNAAKLGLFTAAVAARDKRPVVIVGAGSSTVADGGASSPAAGWMNLLAKSLQATYPLTTGASQPANKTLAEAVTSPPSANGIQLVNAGVGGQRSDSYLNDTTRAQVAALGASVMFHMVGSNDYNTNIAPFHYRDFIKGHLDYLDARTTGTKILHILIHSYQRMDTTNPMYPWDFYRDMMIQIADERTNVAFIDLSQHYAAAGIPGNNPYGLMADLIHQNDYGHKMMADLLRQKLGVADSQSNPDTSQTIIPYRLLSDGFSGAGDILGRTPDNALGGMSAATWQCGTEGNNWVITSGYAEKGASSSTTSNNAGFAVPAVDAQVSLILMAAPTAGGYFMLDLYRAGLNAAGAPNAYRLVIDGATGVRLVKRVGGIETVFHSITAAAATGKHLTLRYSRRRLSYLLDGVVQYTVNDTAVAQGGFIGIGHTSIAPTGKIDNFAIDLLT